MEFLWEVSFMFLRNESICPFNENLDKSIKHSSLPLREANGHRWALLLFLWVFYVKWTVCSLVKVSLEFSCVESWNSPSLGTIKKPWSGCVPRTVLGGDTFQEAGRLGWVHFSAEAFNRLYIETNNFFYIQDPSFPQVS